MASKSDNRENIKEVIRLLNMAIEDCYRLLAEAEDAVRSSEQDNEPQDNSR
jgi:hypothetical protein